MSDACSSCQILYINGFRCHETGCPEAYKDEIRSCEWCGSPFVPETIHEKFCTPECAEAYYG